MRHSFPRHFQGLVHGRIPQELADDACNRHSRDNVKISFIGLMFCLSILFFITTNNWIVPSLIMIVVLLIMCCCTARKTTLQNHPNPVSTQSGGQSHLHEVEVVNTVPNNSSTMSPRFVSNVTADLPPSYATAMATSPFTENMSPPPPPYSAVVGTYNNTPCDQSNRNYVQALTSDTYYHNVEDRLISRLYEINYPVTIAGVHSTNINSTILRS